MKKKVASKMTIFGQLANIILPSSDETASNCCKMFGKAKEKRNQDKNEKKDL